MSTFGAPGQLPSTRPTPPQRGSFPLDHDGECRHIMTNYLSCMKKVKGVNEDECRDLAKSYLSCRMDRNLMARDEFKNLGFADPSELSKLQSQSQAQAQSTQTQQPPVKQSESEKGVKGELRW